ncbi:hypothetical protein RI367_000333 [Sorochytrium milnesiophthora]
MTKPRQPTSSTSSVQPRHRTSLPLLGGILSAPASVVSLLAHVAIVMLATQLLYSAGVQPFSKLLHTSLPSNSNSSSPVASASSSAVEELQHAVAQLRAQNARLEQLIEQHRELVSSGKGVAISPPQQEQRFYMDDFVSYLGVEPIHHVVVDPAIQHLIDAHDITKDQAFLDDEEEMRGMAKRFGMVIDRGTTADRRFYVKFIDGERGFGLFAASPIRRGDILGTYASVLTNASWTTDYVWTYPSVITDPATGQQLDLSLDAKQYGNWFRFANDGEPAAINTGVVYVPYKNVWHVVYVAAKAIERDQEITVSYGESYWKDRTKLHSNGEVAPPPSEGPEQSDMEDSDSYLSMDA